MEKELCAICKRDVEVLAQQRNISGKPLKYKKFSCQNCGKYDVEREYKIPDKIDENQAQLISFHINELNRLFNMVPKIDESKMIELLELNDKRIKEKFDLMMFFLSKPSNNHINETIYENLLIESWIKNHNELVVLYNKAIELVYINGSINSQTYPILNYITFDGLLYLEELETPNINSKNIFIAFNFEDSLKEIFDTYLKAALEDEGFNYVVVNQDNVEHNKSINDEIIVKLKSSRIVIADFTNHRNSVYFEAGYAMGMNIPIIWTCQEGHEDDISFDTRQFPHIIWKDENELIKQVIDRIKVIL